MSEPDGFLARQPAAVDNAFAVLEKVAELGPGTTARQLLAELPMSKATIYRIIKHLVAHEYLVRTPDLTGFILGRRVRALAAAALTPADQSVPSTLPVTASSATAPAPLSPRTTLESNESSRLSPSSHR